MKKYSFHEGWTLEEPGKEKVEVTLPHDAMICHPRTADAPSGSAQGFFTSGSYTYEKRFLLPDAWQGARVLLQFEGVYQNARVYVNGEEAGGSAYGYIPFRVSCGVLPPGENRIVVTCDNQNQPDSRWYTGAGIFRPVWAWVGTGPTEEDIRVTTLQTNPPRIRVEVSPNALSELEQVQIEIWDPHGGQERLMACAQGPTAELDLPDARLWSADDPCLYLCRVTGRDKAGTVDPVETKFGIRTISWSSKGLCVNGRETLLRGGCIHHDNGIVGAAAYDESEYRRAKILKQAGYNAVRSSHNPASRAMLDACDELGLYVMDETWDMWFCHKNRFDYAGAWREHHLDDIRAMAARDFNHPSVIAYSIGNEVSEPAKAQGLQAEQEMVELFHALDPTRPVTGGINLMILFRSTKGKGIYDEEEGGRDISSSEKKIGGMNSTMFNLITSAVGTSMNKSANSKKADLATTPCLDLLDVCGYNYASGRYPLEGTAHPDRLIFGSETFPQDIAKNWAAVKKYPYLCGDFMWTCWDYIGEAGIGTWSYTPDGKGFEKPYPWLLADVGAIDILGNPNGELFWAQAAWGLLQAPAIAVRPVNHPGITPAKGSWRGTNAIPSWSWQGCQGNKAVAEVYFDCAKAELRLNGKSLGKKNVKDCRAVFSLQYAPGELEAIAYDASGAELGRSVLRSAGPAGITLSPEQTQVSPGEILYIPVAIADEAGVTESNADADLEVTVKGGTLLGFGSANPRTEQSYCTGAFRSYYGKALAVVRAGRSGSMEVTVSGPGLACAAAVIQIL